MTSSQRADLRDLILEWITPELIESHNNPDYLHNVNNFLPWHRIHIRELEYFIGVEQNRPDLLPGGVLPYYNPEEIMPEEFYDVVDEYITEDYGHMNINPQVNAYVYNDICNTSYLDAGDFSDRVSLYHGFGHSKMDGAMFPLGVSAACAIFWPWHAWVDEHWYLWECSCEGIFSVDESSELNISTTVTWDTDQTVRGEVVIESGGVLTINNGAVIRFLASDYHACSTRIKVKPGGRLVVNNATLTGFDFFGTQGTPNSYVDPNNPGAVNYHTGWEGIVVEGNNPNLEARGWVTLINDAVVEHAAIGVRSIKGGLIFADGAHFLNNRFDAYIYAYSHLNPSFFKDCRFINDAPLRDVVWISTTVEGFEGVEHHITHDLTHSSEAHVAMVGAQGVSVSDGCLIDNEYQDDSHPDSYISRGVFAFGSRYSVLGSTIRNQVIGIAGLNAVPGPGQHATIRGNTIENNYGGIHLRGVDYSVIEDDNIFFIPDEVPDGYGVPYGIAGDGAGALVIADNRFFTVGEGSSQTNYGVVLANTTGDFASLEKRNLFDGIGIGTQVEQNNGSLQIRCNEYNDFEYGIAVTSGTLANQGICGNSTSPAGNTWDNLNGCSGNESQIYKESTASNFAYRTHSNRKPTCISNNIVADDCLINATGPSCDDPEDPCKDEPFPCPKDEIATLESEKSGKSSEEITVLTYRQRMFYQRETNALLAGWAGGLDSAILFAALVESVTSLYPANKASLLLQKSEPNSLASGTATAIAAVSSADPNKAWLTLQYDLLDSDRTYEQLTSTEEQFIFAEAEEPTKSGAHARAILEIAYKQSFPATFEPIGSERSIPLTYSASAGPIIIPNPVSELTFLSLTLPELPHASYLRISDINGRICQKIDISNVFGTVQIPFSARDMAEGVYLVQLHINGSPLVSKKLIVIR